MNPPPRRPRGKPAPAGANLKRTKLMHHLVFVVGDDVEAQMNGLMAQNEHGWAWCDWWAIGGRFTGNLPLRPGATGKTFGDAAPPFEEWMAKMASEKLGVVDQRGTRDMTGTGVDQARVGDIDMAALPAPHAWVKDGQVMAESWDTISPDSVAISISMAMAQKYMDRGDVPPFPPPSDEKIERAKSEDAAWRSKVMAQLQALPADALLTVVDAHS
jgi:hypothetical protein